MELKKALEDGRKPTPAKPMITLFSVLYLTSQVTVRLQNWEARALGLSFYVIIFAFGERFKKVIILFLDLYQQSCSSNYDNNRQYQHRNTQAARAERQSELQRQYYFFFRMLRKSIKKPKLSPRALYE